MGFEGPGQPATISEHWVEHPEHALPEGLLEFAEGESISIELSGLRVRLSAQKYPDGTLIHFHARLGDTLKEVFVKASHALDERLLPPPPLLPLDLCRLRRHNGHWDDPITDFELPLWAALAEGLSRHTSIEYRLEVRINTKWGVASKKDMTPRELLVEFGFKPEEFSLYRPDSTQVLPPDTPIELHRGEHFEAQKDGKYGGGAATPVVIRGNQTIEDDVSRLKAEDADLVLHTVGTQKFVEARGVRIPSPPWSHASANILIAIPATYPMGALDALYLEQGVTQGGSVPRQQSTVQILGRNWSLISWHYATARPWSAMADDVGTHIEHCRGYFLARGVSQ